MIDLHRVADVIANTISLGGDPLDVARELAKRGLLASIRAPEASINIHYQPPYTPALRTDLIQEAYLKGRRDAGR